MATHFCAAASAGSLLGRNPSLSTLSKKIGSSSASPAAACNRRPASQSCWGLACTAPCPQPRSTHTLHSMASSEQGCLGPDACHAPGSNVKHFWLRSLLATLQRTAPCIRHGTERALVQGRPDGGERDAPGCASSMAVMGQRGTGLGGDGTRLQPHGQPAQHGLPACTSKGMCFTTRVAFNLELSICICIN